MLGRIMPYVIVLLAVTAMLFSTGPFPVGTALAHDPPPPPPGTEGCTPGYWKQAHHQPWTGTGFTPSQNLSSVFTIPGSLSSFASWSLDLALEGGGGAGLSGAAQILFRAAVAALLNAAHPDVDYPLSVSSITSQVNAALASGNRSTILNLAADLDSKNNLGCTLN